MKYTFRKCYATPFFQEELGDPGAGSAGNPESPDSSQSDTVIKNPEHLLSAFEKLKEEKKAWKTDQSELKRLQGLMSSFESILGKALTPEQLLTIKTEVAEAERVRNEANQQKIEIEAAAIEKAKATLQPQIETLTQSNTQLVNQITAIFEQQATQQAFTRHNGADLTAFLALAPTVFKPVFQEIEDASSPTGKRKQLLKFTQLDGQPLTDAQGKELELSEVFSKANQGYFGKALQATFHDYNQSSGDGFVQNSADGSTIKNPWSKEHHNLTEQGNILRNNPALARQLRAAAK